MEHDSELAKATTAAVSGLVTAVLATLAGVADTFAAAAMTGLVVVAATYAGFAVGRVVAGEAADASTSTAGQVALAGLFAVAVVAARVLRGSTSGDPVGVGTVVAVTAAGAFAVLKLVAGCQTAYRTFSS
jgi:hypothetical protein